jgi:lycopene cyclase domain-containing protein
MPIRGVVNYKLHVPLAFFGKLYYLQLKMFGKLTYIVWLIIFVWLPETLLFLKFRGVFSRYKKTFVFAILGCLVFAWPWDYAVIKDSTWFFPPESILGITVGGIPFEEHLFIVFVGLLVTMVTLILRRR